MIDNFYSQIQITYKHVKMYQEKNHFIFKQKYIFKKKSSISIFLCFISSHFVFSHLFFLKQIYINCD